MAKTDTNNTFGDFSKKIKLSKDRQNLKPVNPKLSFDQYLSHALQEGYAILEAEGSGSVKPKDSVKPSATAPKSDSVKLENKLGEISKNAYVRARTVVLNKLKPEVKAIIEKMEKEELPKDTRWDTFCKAITKLGDDFSE